MKCKIIKTIAFVIIPVLFFGFCFRNSIILSLMDCTAYIELSKNSDIKILDRKSCYGKLNGNGSGIQYFGAFLVSAKSKDMIEPVIKNLSSEFEIVSFEQSSDHSIQTRYLEHRELSFNTSINITDSCFIIFYFNSHHPLSNEADILGH